MQLMQKWDVRSFSKKHKKVVFEKVFTRGISENLRKCILYIVSCHGYSKVPTSSLVFIKPICQKKFLPSTLTE